MDPTIARQVDPKEVEERITKCHGYLKYNAIKEARHEMAKLLWYWRNTVTDPITERIFTYDETVGYYQRTGELMLRADLLRLFENDMNQHTANEVMAKVKAMSYMPLPEIEKTTPPNLIPIKNGVYNLDTNELIRHSPSYFFTYKHPVEYDPEATCPTIDKFLNEVVSDDKSREILIDIMALCLYRDRISRKFFILTGSGHNGKSKYIDIIREVIGADRCCSVTPQELSENDFAGSLLHDRHVNLGADIPGGKIHNASILKGVTGGDMITVQKKGKDHFDIRPYVEFVYSSNDPPRFSEDTFALWGRLVVIKFPYTFCDNPKEQHEKLSDPELGKKLLEPRELSGFLNRALKRLPELIKRQNISVHIDEQEVKKEYQTITNSAGAFLEEMCEPVFFQPGTVTNRANGYIVCSELYSIYTKWCHQKGLKVVSQNYFTRRILDAPGWPIEVGKDRDFEGERNQTYRGIQFKQQIDGQSGPPGHSFSLFSSTLSKVQPRIKENDGPGGQVGPVRYENFDSDDVFPTKNDILQTIRSVGVVTTDSLLSLYPGEVRVENYIEELKRDGFIFEPTKGTLRLL